MPDSDPKRDFAVDVVRSLQQAGFRALWAGGCVRDLLLGHAPDDYDVATSARPDEVQALFGARRTRPIGASFGVILVHGPRGRGAGDIEVATFRTEGPYLDGRHPTNVRFATPEEDAQRRDFTMNGMFFDPLTEEVLDFVGGREDLANRVVRAIGDPQARFAEDKLRMLRAVRMTARFDFDLDPVTSSAVRGMVREILVVSGERISQELRKMLTHVHRERAMRLADELGILSVILPELAPLLSEPGAARWLETLTMLDRLDDPGFELSLATLLFEALSQEAEDDSRGTIATLGRRLRLANREVEQTTWLITRSRETAGAATWPLSRVKRLLAEPGRDDLLALLRVAAVSRNKPLIDLEYLERMRNTLPEQEVNPPPLISGDDLIAAGLKPGARFKDLLDQIRDAQLDGTLNSKDEALDWVRARSVP
jgi:poly(A) polymerase